MAAKSSDTIFLSNKARGTCLFTMRVAKPSTIADLPTPGSPINTGLFFFLRLSICIVRCISCSRPTTGSNSPSAAAFDRSREKLSNAGVVELGFDGIADVLILPPLFCLRGISSSSSSKSSSLSYTEPGFVCGTLLPINVLNFSYVTPISLNNLIKSVSFWRSMAIMK